MIVGCFVTAISHASVTVELDGVRHEFPECEDVSTEGTRIHVCDHELEYRTGDLKIEASGQVTINDDLIMENGAMTISANITEVNGRIMSTGTNFSSGVQGQFFILYTQEPANDRIDYHGSGAVIVISAISISSDTSTQGNFVVVDNVSTVQVNPASFADIDHTPDLSAILTDGYIKILFRGISIMQTPLHPIHLESNLVYGYEWYHNSWLGMFYLNPLDSDWLWHEKIGWIYVFGRAPDVQTSLDTYFFWSPEWGWLYAGKATRGYYYCFNDEQWRLTSNPDNYFHNWQNGTMEILP